MIWFHVNTADDLGQKLEVVNDPWNGLNVNKEFPFSLFLCGPGSHDDYEYMRKFSSNDDSINHSSPTSSFQYPVYSQLDKNGENIEKLYRRLFFFIKLQFPDYIMDDYYTNRPNLASSTVNYNNNVITNKNNLNLLVTSNEEIRVPVVRVVKRRTTANKKVNVRKVVHRLTLKTFVSFTFNSHNFI